MERTTFLIVGMDCSSCAVDIEKQLKSMQGVKKAIVNYATEKAYVEYDSHGVTQDQIADEVIKRGYQVIFPGEGHKDTADIAGTIGFDLFTLQLIISILLTTLLLIGTFIPWAPPFLKNKWVMMALATPIQFWIGWRYYRGMIAGLRRGTANMDTLIALGSSIAYFYSVFVLFFESYFVRAGIPTYVYFESSATIITFIFLGKYLETWAKRRASQAIRSLMQLKPKEAIVLRETVDDNGNKIREWISISGDDVVVGDIIRVKPGKQVPIDGTVTKGASTIDESMVTGESMPVDKKEGDDVVGGTINKSGVFEMKATKVGEQTMLAGIIQMVERAQQEKAPVQKLVDRISAVFVPIVIVLSVISFIGWYIWGPEPPFLHALQTMITVLIIACPCALGLATPTSLMVALGKGATSGILIKDAIVLESAGTVDMVVFDKTGTLTAGKLVVHDALFVKNLEKILHTINWIPPRDMSASAFLAALIVALESLSSHPISTAVVIHMKDRFKLDSRLIEQFDVSSFENKEGLGLYGIINGHTVLIGSRYLMEIEHISMPEQTEQCALQWSREAKTISFVAIDKSCVATFCVGDTIRPEAKEAVEQLLQMNIQSAMITGDNKLSAQAVADQIGIKEVFAQVIPEKKAAYVEKLKKEGKRVAMVGDGINDAPALAVADVGIAMGGGTDVALETAGAALLRNDLLLVPKLVILSKATLRNIRQNLVWAFGYNILLIPVAMGVLYPFFGITINPMLAGGAMAFSSLSVVLNALRLRWVW